MIDTVNEEFQKVDRDIVFRVYQPPIDIRIEEHNSLLDELLDQNKCLEWAFITASNPYGKQLNRLQNFRRHEDLREKLHHYRLFEGEVVTHDESESVVKGFLIVGIIRSDAAKFGLLFEQNSIVVGRKGTQAEILSLR